MEHWNVTAWSERARERQAVLEKEAKRQRLLREITDSTQQFALFRKAALFTGNVLIAVGLWLKRRATPVQNPGHLTTMAGRFS